MKGITGSSLDRLYRDYNRRELVHPDPLEFLYHYNSFADREVAGLIASSLAYGRVAQILKSVSSVLDRIEKPREFLEKSSPTVIRNTFKKFKHRFTTGDELSNMLIATKKAIGKYGSLGECFASKICKNDETVLPAMVSFVEEMNEFAGCELGYLLPTPEKGSACKRFNLFLRWMVRSDDVDPGGWHSIPASKLIVPLDTHMYRICSGFGFTRRKQANLKTAVEITNAFRKFAPHDPVKYDFVLTRFGIRGDMKISALND